MIDIIDKKIKSIKFSCLSPEEIRAMSAVKIITADTYDDEGYPFVGGLMDSRMGVIEPGLKCKTCGCKVDDCPGHFGHIELARPVIHVGYVKEIKDILESTCCECGRLLLTNEEIKERIARMKEIHDLGGDTNDLKLYVKDTVKVASSRTFCMHKRCICANGDHEDVMFNFDDIESLYVLRAKDAQAGGCDSIDEDTESELERIPIDLREGMEFIPRLETVIVNTRVNGSEAAIEQPVDYAVSITYCVKDGVKLLKVTRKKPVEQSKIKLDKPTTFRIIKENNKKLTPEEVRERLEKVSNDDLPALGLDPAVCRPEWMVLTVLAVPPVTVRPSITLESGDRSEDDLTHKLVDVLRINQRLRENRDNGAPQLIVEDLWELLQYHVTTYFDNQTSGIPPARHRSGRPLKTLAQRLKGKEGRFRSNLSGKRVNFSARTVISPDPNLSINHVGVPVRAARELTVRMHVNEHNLEEMRKFVGRGPLAFGKFLREDGTYDLDASNQYVSEERTDVEMDSDYLTGVNYVFRNDGRRIKVTTENASTVAENLNIDYAIERQLNDGRNGERDIVLFNRQPSLHRMSIMAHRVVVMPGRTFRFNLTDCAPYNADFDGDEMNLHVLQSEEARAEARIIMQVQENILSPRYGGPIIGGIHDHISGSYFLTHGDVRFNRYETMNILYKLSDIGLGTKKNYLFDELNKEGCRPVPEPTGTDENGEPYWSGKDLFSLALPSDLNLTFRAAVCQCGPGTGCRAGLPCPTDGYVKIRNGRLLTGTIDKKGIGNSDGKILEKIARDYGSERAAKFLYDATRLALGAIMNHGFSTGISDEDLPEEAVHQITEFSKERIQEVQDLVTSYAEGTLSEMPGRDLKETLEVRASSVLGKARSRAGEIAGEHLGMNNPAVIMAKTGARGSMLNLSQMAGCVGQQNVRGERITRGYWGRTLPHFRKGDLGAFAKGFCLHSYKAGLDPTEFFFHAMGGREGLVDTAVRTARSGYMQRRLISALEDLKLTNENDATMYENGRITNTIGAIVQFKYGEDGVDPSKAVRGASVNLDDLFTEVLGEDADKLLNLDKKENEGDDYGAREKDLENFEDDSDYEGDEDSLDSQSDSDYEGGE
jgi:DNA-directed RNA polymerase subunit A'